MINFQKQINKLVKLQLVNGSFFEGKILEVNVDSILFSDRFSTPTYIPIDKIVCMQEVKDDRF